MTINNEDTVIIFDHILVVLPPSFGSGIVRTIDPHGNRAWYLDSQLHRTDGPALDYCYDYCYDVYGSAIEYANGDCEWWLYDLRHRLDGPAVDWNDNKQWFYMDKRINCNSQEEFERLLKLKAFW